MRRKCHMAKPFTFGWVESLFLLHSLTLCAAIYYTAAVVEHNPYYTVSQNVTRDEALAIMMKNLDVYEQHIHNASLRGAHIIVFPEDGLYGAYFLSRAAVLPYLEHIPNVNFTLQKYVNPCDSEHFPDRPVLRRLSCLAHKYNIVVVANMGDIQPCTSEQNPDCPSDGRFQYNTQVAFDGDGTLLAKYHKSHLYFEPQWNAGNGQGVWFTSSLIGSGTVRIGLMICFDLLFAEPQLSLQSAGVSDVAFSTWWVNFPPIITATQVQQAWARWSDGNLMAAGIGLSWYTSGSGIYRAGDGTPWTTFYNDGGKPIEALLMANVSTWSTTDAAAKSKTPNTRTMLVHEAFYVGAVNKNNFTFSTFKAVPGSSGSISVTAKVSSIVPTFTCTVNYSVSASGHDSEPQIFGVVALDGWYNEILRVQICGLMRCSNEHSCTEYEERTSTVFDSWSVSSSDFVWGSEWLAMVATDHVQLVDTSMYVVNQADSVLQSTPGQRFAPPLLNACVFAVQWQQN